MIYGIYIALVFPTFITYMIRTAFASNENTYLVLCSIELGLKVLFTCFDGILVYQFIMLILYFLDYKLERIGRRNGRRNLTSY